MKRILGWVLGWMLLVAGLSNAATNDDGLALAHQLENAFVKVAEDASGSVVVITSTRKAGQESDEDEADEDDEDQPEIPHQFEGTPFEFFFRHHGQPAPDQDIDSQGSGIILRKDGYILTNSHVIRGADTINVRLKDKREFPAKVIGVDNRTDMAVIKVEAQDLPAAQLGDSDAVRVGQWAIAIGAPYQLDYSFTVGFVSAKSRPPMEESIIATIDYIQTDASINPGNSGGPLCDIDGRVIGINTLIRGLNRGIGFAIPINVARDVADRLIEKGKVVRSWLGIAIEPLSENKDLQETGTNLTQGVVVRAIYPDTPAANSDLRPADIIVAVDGVNVETSRDLQKQVLGKNVGDKVTLQVIRGGKPVTVSLTTGEFPDRLQYAGGALPHDKGEQQTWGLTVQTLTPKLAERLGVEHAGGVVVTAVETDSLAETRGMQHGDVITEVNRVPVRSAVEFKKAMEKGDNQKGVLLYVKRAGTFTFVVLKE